MGASCCGGGQGRRRRMRNKMVHSAAEPLLRESEREAVSSLLRYLEEGSGGGTISDDSLLNLCTLAYSENVDLQRSAALCFSEFSEKLTEPVSETVLEPLIHLLVSSDIEVQKASSHALSNLALHGASKNKKTIVSAGALRPLIVLLSVTNSDIQCNACGCITTLATLEANKMDIVREGAVPPLLSLSHSIDIKVQRNAAGALLNLTHIESNRHVLVEAGAISVFVQLLDSSDEDIQFYSAAALSNLAVHESYRKAIVTSGEGRALRSLIKLMEPGREKVCCQACLAIRNLGSDGKENIKNGSSQQLIVAEGGLTVLVPLLKSADSETVTAAVAALRNLSIHKGNEVAIIETGALEDLKRLVAVQDHPDIQCHSAGTLRNLAAENQTLAVLGAGCLEALGESLVNFRSMPGPVVAEVCAALAVLASEGAARKAIMLMCDGNLYRILVDLMNSPLSEVKYNSSGVIGHLAMDEEYHDQLLASDLSVLQLISQLLSSSEINFVHISLWIITQFSSVASNSTKAKFRDSGLIDKLSQVKMSKQSADLVAMAEGALAFFNGTE